VSAPVAPWALTGESLVGLARCRGPVPGPLPGGLSWLPGPALVVANRYTDSPVGPYLELAIGHPARLGVRPGWCFSTMVVDSPAARMGGRLNWGFPKELGRLLWTQDGEERELRWLDRDICVRGVPGRFVVPALVPMRALQRRGDGPVVVPGVVRGRARFAAVHVYAPSSDPFSVLVGAHRGVHLQGLRFTVRPARRPVGFASTLLAPSRAPEPALLSWSAPGD
jgi:hypothetical protein